MGAFRGAGPPGGHRLPGAADGPRRRRAGHRPGRAPPRATSSTRPRSRSPRCPAPRYDVGDYDLPLREALRLADYDKLREEQARRAARRATRSSWASGSRVYVEITAGGGGSEYGSVTVHADGSATISAGTSAHGQGHATAFAMLASDRLGIPMDTITLRAVRHGDRAARRRAPAARGRCRWAATPSLAAADDVLEQARRRAAELLEAAVDDVELTEDGEFGVAGVPVDHAHLGAGRRRTARSCTPGLDFRQEGATFPFGAHVSVVEVDTETGPGHAAAARRGRRLRPDPQPAAGRGQQHGGLAQGIAQALYEEVLFDADGQPLTATLADYRMPTAADLFCVRGRQHRDPDADEPAWAPRASGSRRRSGATPAVQNAVVDALRPFGVRHVDLPCSPQRVWRAIQDARAGAAATRGASRRRCSRRCRCAEGAVRRGGRGDLTRSRPHPGGRSSNRGATTATRGCAGPCAGPDFPA